jgi:hypothetical protein
MFSEVREAILYIRKSWVPKFTRKNIISFIKHLPVNILIFFLLIIYGIGKILSIIVIKTYSRGRTITYGILKPCYLCTYGDKYNGTLISTKSREARVILLEGKAWVRKGECLGLKNCYKCYEQINKPDENLPCKWNKF